MAPIAATARSTPSFQAPPQPIRTQLGNRFDAEKRELPREPLIKSREMR